MMILFLGDHGDSFDKVDGRQKILCFVFLCCLSEVSISQTNKNESSQKLKQEFEHQTEQWKEAYNSKDAQNLVPLYAEEACYISSHVAGLEA